MVGPLSVASSQTSAILPNSESEPMHFTVGIVAARFPLTFGLAQGFGLCRLKMCWLNSASVGVWERLGGGRVCWWTQWPRVGVWCQDPKLRPSSPGNHMDCLYLHCWFWQSRSKYPHLGHCCFTGVRGIDSSWSELCCSQCQPCTGYGPSQLACVFQHRIRIALLLKNFIEAERVVHLHFCAFMFRHSVCSCFFKCRLCIPSY